MPKKTKTISVNNFSGEFHSGISITRLSVKDIPHFKGEDQSERHDRHSFHLLEKGNVTIEIDFQKHKLKPSTVIYMHPDQVHRIASFENVTVISLAINNENKMMSWIVSQLQN